MWQWFPAAWNGFWSWMGPGRYDQLAARLEKHIRDGEARYETVRQELDGVRQELRECKDAHAEEKSRANRAEKELRTVRGKLKGLKVQNRKQQSEIDQLKARAQP